MRAPSGLTQLAGDEASTSPAIGLRPVAVFQSLIGATLVLLALGLLGVGSTYLLGHGRLLGLVPLVSMHREDSLPGLYSTMLALASAAVLWVLALSRMRDRLAHPRLTFLLAVVFSYVAIDDGIAIHEAVSDAMRERLALDGLLFHAWLIPGVLVVALLTAVLWPWLRDLPGIVRRRALLAASLYLGGAVVLEALGGPVVSGVLNGDEAKLPVYRTMQCFEEALEMAGYAVFLYAMLMYAGLLRCAVAVRAPMAAGPS
jgi:hypothetical protein